MYLNFDLAVLSSSARQAAYACFDDFTSHVPRIHTLHGFDDGFYDVLD